MARNNDIRRMILADIYSRMSDEEKKALAEQRNRYEMMSILSEINRKADKNHHSFTGDLLANISGNIITGGATWLIKAIRGAVR